MSDALKLGFAPFAAPARIGAAGVLIVFCDDALKFGPATTKAIAPGCWAGHTRGQGRALHRQERHGARLSCPAGLHVARLVVIGAGKAAELKRRRTCVKLGGLAMGKLPLAAREAMVFAELPGGALKADAGRRSRARREAARLCLRPLQDQAQGGREAAGQAQHDASRVADVAAARKAWRDARGGRRRRAAGARSGQRAGRTCSIRTSSRAAPRR